MYYIYIMVVVFYNQPSYTMYYIIIDKSSVVIIVRTWAHCMPVYMYVYACVYVCMWYRVNHNMRIYKYYFYIAYMR